MSCSQVLYLVLFSFNLPEKMFKKAHNEVNFSGVYLRRIGALRSDSPRGQWTLADNYSSITFEEAKRITYEKYDKSLGRK